MNHQDRAVTGLKSQKVKRFGVGPGHLGLRRDDLLNRFSNLNEIINLKLRRDLWGQGSIKSRHESRLSRIQVGLLCLDL